MNRVLVLLLFVILPLSAFADCSAKKKRASTPYGVLYEMKCSVGKRTDSGYEYSLLLGDRLLLKDSFLIFEDRNAEQSVWVLGGRHSVEHGCTSRQYLIDLSRSPVLVLAFGVDGACSVFHWAKWGQRKSAIALKRNVKFSYQDGVLSKPEINEDLYYNIQIDVGEASFVNVGSIVPFVEQVVVKGGSD